MDGSLRVPCTFGNNEEGGDNTFSFILSSPTKFLVGARNVHGHFHDDLSSDTCWLCILGILVTMSRLLLALIDHWSRDSTLWFWINSTT